MVKGKLKNRSFGWKLLFLSLILAGGVIYLLRESFYPNDFEIVEKISGKLDYEFAYHDFDHDGFSEMMEIRNYAANRYNITVRNWNGGTIDQANYWEPIESDGLMFKDINGDGFDEIFGFTQKNDSIYFYLHDLLAKNAIIKRLFITCVKEPITSDRDAAFFPVCIADTNFYKSKVFIFAARTHNALQPRSVYAIDLDSQKIVAEFSTRATLANAFPFDLNGDGLDEVIVYSIASGNVHYPAKYKDDKCWLFVLDQKLKPLFPPISFSQYPAFLYCLPIEIYSDKYILAVPEYYGEKNLDNSVYLINSLGKIFLKEQNPFKKLQQNLVGYNPIVDRTKNPSIIYGWKEYNSVIKLNHQLKIIKSDNVEFNNPQPYFIRDVNNDGKNEIFYLSDNFFLVFDKELNLLAKFPNPGREANIDFRLTGPYKPVELSLQFPGQYYRLKLVENKLSSYLPLIFIGFTGFFFLMLTGTHSLLTIVVRHIRFFKYLRFDSSDGILIINNIGIIIYYNNRLVQILNLQQPLIKGKEAVSILNHYSKIVEIIKKGITTGERVDQKILLANEGSETEYEISVQPYKYIFKKRFNYLIIIKSASISTHSEKIHTWSRAVQKMAHDIKTPLSTVALNLRVLQGRLEKIPLSNQEYDEISDDIQMMRTELDNIQSVTKNFLKFSNLDKPHCQAFDIKSIIEKAKNKFQPYINSDLSIELAIDKDIKAVWADPHQVEMVFNILLENSLAAMHGKGIININVTSVQFLDKKFVESIEIEVADTGPGINEEDKKRIFDPYFSTKSEGTGMGLAIAKKIIEDNGGLIEVYSKPKSGAVFRFSLPVIKEEEKNE